MKGIKKTVNLLLELSNDISSEFKVDNITIFISQNFDNNKGEFIDETKYVLHLNKKTTPSEEEFIVNMLESNIGLKFVIAENGDWISLY
jgi:hypothetical protein